MMMMLLERSAIGPVNRRVLLPDQDSPFLLYGYA